MLHKFKRSAAVLSAVVAVSLATPAMAGHRDWGRHRDRVDAGDVLTGILIIGGIAAIASAASSGNRDRYRDRDRQREQRERDYRYQTEQQDGDYRNPDQRGDGRGYGDAEGRPEWQEGRGIDAAVNRCVGEVERGNQRVESVDQVSRDGQGWRIAGQTSSGTGFTCTIDSDGRIRSSAVDGAAY